MIIYRASELGACTKRLVAKRIGYEPIAVPSKMQEVFDRGNEVEQEVIDDLNSRAWFVDSEQLEVNLSITGEIVVQGHIDGMLTDEIDSPRRVLEVKSMADEPYQDWKKNGWQAGGLIPRYKWQVSAYMLATDRELVFWVRNKDTGDDWPITIEEPFYSYDTIKNRVLLVEAQARHTKLPRDCDDRMYPCPFFYLHEDEEVVEDEEIETLGIAYGEARSRERAAKESLSKIRERIEGSLGDRDRVDTGRVKVSRYSTDRRTIDRGLLEGDGIDVSKYERTTTTESIRVTVREDDASQGQSGS